MKLNKELKIQKIAKRDDYRPGLNYIQFHNGYAYCSDGYIAIKASIGSIIIDATIEDEKKLEGKAILASHYAELLKYEWIAITDEYIEGRGDFCSARYSFLNSDLKLPDIVGVFDKKIETSKQETNKVININYLKKFSNVMRDPKFVLDKCIGNAYIVTQPYKDYNITGIIMPAFAD